jgi:hypothetical protein
LNYAAWVLLVVGLLVAPDAMAYVDPNAPGLIFQLFFPLIVGATIARNWLVKITKRIWSALVRTKD